MGKLIKGQWHVAPVATNDDQGSYQRVPRTFTSIPGKDRDFPIEKNRYHLYVSYACPWATRTLIYRELMHLQDWITVNVVHPDMLDDGWTFQSDFPATTGDQLYGEKFLRSLYLKADPEISTTVTVPILWDKTLHTIVNNESSQIIRIFHDCFRNVISNQPQLMPASLMDKIEQTNDFIYHNINNGVYKVGFASSQKAYNTASKILFDSLEKLDNILGKSSYVNGDLLTESDIYLIPTLLRFDGVYHTHFKCNYKQIKDYKNLWEYTQRLYEIDAIKNTHHIDHILRHYYYSHDKINPYRIVPPRPSHVL